MTREVSLTVVLISASIAAAMAAPDTAAPAPHAGWAVGQAAGERNEGARYVAAAPQVAVKRLAPCQPDAGAVYRQWHHGSAKLLPGCTATVAGLGELAELQ